MSLGDRMNLIDELVTEVENISEDKSTFNALKSEGINPFKTKNIADTFKASEISSIILKDLVDRVDGCDSSFASLVFMQTEEGLRDFKNKIKAKEALEDGVGGFVRADNLLEICEPHEITPDESKAIAELVSDYENKTNL